METLTVNVDHLERLAHLRAGHEDPQRVEGQEQVVDVNSPVSEGAEDEESFRQS